MKGYVSDLSIIHGMKASLGSAVVVGSIVVGVVVVVLVTSLVSPFGGRSPSVRRGLTPKGVRLSLICAPIDTATAGRPSTPAQSLA